MSKFNNEMYDKGYNDGFSDAINSLELEDILELIPALSKEEIQEIINVIKKCE